MAKAATATKEVSNNGDALNPTNIQGQVAEHAKHLDNPGQLEPASDASGVEIDMKVFERESAIWENKGTTVPELIKFDHIVIGDENVRSTATLQLDKMVLSLKNRGYDPKYPIVVSKKSNTRYLVLCGHRRVESLTLIKKNEPAVFKVVLPDGVVPALVLEGLTPEEEMLIRLDHSTESDRVALDDEGMFLSIRQFVKNGYADSQADIAKKMGLLDTTGQPNRSLVQQRVNLARLPAYVQDEFLKLMRDKNSTNVRWAMTAKLYKLYRAGRQAGHVDGGSAFKDEWAKCLKPKTRTTATENAENAKVMSKKQLEEASQTLGSTVAQQLLMTIGGYPQKDPETGAEMTLQQIDSRMVHAEQAMNDLMDIREHMGAAKFDKMMAEITAKRQKKARAEEAEQAE